MNARGRKPVPPAIPLFIWLLVELDRDLRGARRRRSVREASEVIAKRFYGYGKLVPAETIRRQYKAGGDLLASRTDARADAEAILAQAREHRSIHGWPEETLNLLGVDRDGIARMFGWFDGVICRTRASLGRNEKRLEQVKRQIVDLERQRDEIFAQKARLDKKLN
jgi:hypothetical protein